jgi:hypothetical protein
LQITGVAMKRLLVCLLLLSATGCGTRSGNSHVQPEPELAQLGVPEWLTEGGRTTALELMRFSIRTPVIFRLRIYRDGAVIHEVSVGKAMIRRCADSFRDRGGSYSVDTPGTTVGGQGVLFFGHPSRVIGGGGWNAAEVTDHPDFARLSLRGSVHMTVPNGSMYASLDEDATAKLSDILTVAEMEHSAKGQLVFRATAEAEGSVNLSYNSLQEPQRIMCQKWEVYERGKQRNSGHVYFWELIVESGGGWEPTADAKVESGSSTSQAN